MPCLAAIYRLYPLGSVIASFKDWATIVQENSTNQTVDILVEDQLQPSLDLVTVSQEQELHNPNSKTEHIVLIYSTCISLLHHQHNYSQDDPYQVLHSTIEKEDSRGLALEHL